MLAAARHALGFGTGLVFANAALSAKAVFKPTKEFHTAHHTLYSAEKNMEIDSRERRGRARQIPRERDPARAQGLGNPCVNVAPVAASVKTKLGRGGTGEE